MRHRSISLRRTSTFRTSSSGHAPTQFQAIRSSFPRPAARLTPQRRTGYALGELDAIGFSPFAIESYKANDALGDAYDVLRQLTPLVLEHQGDDSMIGVRPPVSFDGVIDDTPPVLPTGRLHVARCIQGNIDGAGAGAEDRSARRVDHSPGRRRISRRRAGTDRHVLDRWRDCGDRKHLGRDLRRRPLGAGPAAQR